MRRRGGPGNMRARTLVAALAVFAAGSALLPALSGWTVGSQGQLPSAARAEERQQRAGPPREPAPERAGPRPLAVARSPPQRQQQQQVAVRRNVAGADVSGDDAGFADPFYTGEVIRHDDAPPTQRPLVPGAVILILYGGRFGGSFFINYALPRLRAHFLRCWPYPFHVFYEADAAGDLPKLRELMYPSNVTFELISFAQLPIASARWSGLPPGTTEATIEKWRQEGTQRKFQGRGYRMMCRFWTGPVWRFPTVRRYSYYLRLDTDSIIPRPVPRDPFQKLVRNRCEYGFNRLKGENPHVLHELWPTAQRWMREEKLSDEQRGRVEALALRGGKYWGPMYFNNFEMGTFALKRDPTYQSFFRFVDSQPPYGIFRYRWGDAPLHTIPVTAILRKDQLCNISRTAEFPYNHAPAKSKLLPVQETAPCPGG
eukprot:TRINITY_DN6824_c0_g1_i1.p1 TRINITY_DN6824_c0_g1~~TRINITY_DN6824_c0_g1_i1.p1  ORF type:complete len:428 (+),score=101.36 TRINITY_DN6824_c0_g1_i1:70-1353(+)